jgi:drug/metabolite transporter (DMT)-like permease
MIHHLIAAASFGILPVLYKGLLMKDIETITILIIVKLLIAFFTISLIFYGNNYEIIKNDLNILKKASYNKCFQVTALFIIAAIVYLYGQYSYIIVFKGTETNISTIIIACYPVITILLSYYYFNETINIYQLIGILLIFTGLALITNKVK